MNVLMRGIVNVLALVVGCIVLGMALGTNIGIGIFLVGWAILPVAKK